MEFFRPLCDLVEDRLSLEVGQLELSSQAEVPPLVELCLRMIRKADLGECPDACYRCAISQVGIFSSRRQAMGIHVNGKIAPRL